MIKRYSVLAEATSNDGRQVKATCWVSPGEDVDPFSVDPSDGPEFTFDGWEVDGGDATPEEIKMFTSDDRLLSDLEQDAINKAG